MNARTALIVCTTLVIGGLLLTGLAMELGNANQPTALNDTWLTAQTKVALFTDARVMGRVFNVESAQGVVMIRGNVNSDQTRKTVEDIASGIDGVKSVKNDLQIVRLVHREVSNDKHKAVAVLDQPVPCPDRSN